MAATETTPPKKPPPPDLLEALMFGWPALGRIRAEALIERTGLTLADMPAWDAYEKAKGTRLAKHWIARVKTPADADRIHEGDRKDVSRGESDEARQAAVLRKRTKAVIEDATIAEANKWEPPAQFFKEFKGK